MDAHDVLLYINPDVRLEYEEWKALEPGAIEFGWGGAPVWDKYIKLFGKYADKANSIKEVKRLQISLDEILSAVNG